MQIIWKLRNGPQMHSAKCGILLKTGLSLQRILHNRQHEKKTRLLKPSVKAGPQNTEKKNANF